MMKRVELRKRSRRAFSLVEVVLALGVISFAIVAILGVLPIALQTGHSAQDDTRARQIAQDILGCVASQAQSNYPNAVIAQAGTSFSHSVNIGSDAQVTLGANNDGQLVDPYSADLPYKITITIDADPAGFDVGYASEITIRVEPKSQDFRDFVRIISRY
jgi:type II secretory pathway pseudopilin PulG